MTRLDPSGAERERMTYLYDITDSLVSNDYATCVMPNASCYSWSVSNTVAHSDLGLSTDYSLTTLAGGQSTLLFFDHQGQLSNIVDANHIFTGSNAAGNFTTTVDRDYGGRVVSKELQDGARSPNTIAKTAFSWDYRDNQLSATDANGNVTSYSYDDWNHRLKEVSPIRGTTTYQYDAVGNVISSADGNGSITTMTYDVLNRMTKRVSTLSGGSQENDWTYDNPTSGVFGIGHLASISDNQGSTAYTYDRRGIITLETRTSHWGDTFVQQYSHDANGNRNVIVYPSGSTVGYTFDYADRPYSVGTLANAPASLMVSRRRIMRLANGRPNLRGPARLIVPAAILAKMKRHHARQTTPTHSNKTVVPLILPGRAIPVRHDNAVHSAITAPAIPTSKRKILSTGNATVYVNSATYLPFGPLTTVSFGNGSVQTLQYNSNYWLTRNTLTSAGTTVADYAYSTDSNGNITGILDNTDHTYDPSYGYDVLNRLTSANSGTSLWGTATGNGYVYDAMGNMTLATLGSVQQTSFSYNGATPKLNTVTELGTANSISYDSAGNLISDGIEYNFITQQNQINQTAFPDGSYTSSTWDSFGRRIMSWIYPPTASDWSFRYDLLDSNSHLLAESILAQGSTQHTIQYEYIWFGDRPVAQTDGSGVHWTFADHLGAPLLQTDDTGTVTYRSESDPYGNILKLRGADTHQPIRMPGQYSEQFDTGANGFSETSYNLHRFYTPKWGRYTQYDPLGSDDATNPYAYAEDNPISKMDSSGLCAVDVRFHRLSGPFRQLGSADPWHGFVVTSENDGSAQTSFQGDPTNTNFFNFGSLVASETSFNSPLKEWGSLTVTSHLQQLIIHEFLASASRQRPDHVAAIGNSSRERSLA